MTGIKACCLAAILSVFLFAAGGSAEVGASGGSRLLVLAYHDIPAYVWLDDYGVDGGSFVEQIEYLRAHGYNFVSLDDVVGAGRGLNALPEKPVLLTFDDGFLSYYEFVSPVLQLYGIPSVLSVVTGWIEDSPPPDLNAPLMTREQLAELAENPLVEIASHTHNLHRGITYNPRRNQGPATTSRFYDPETGGYEDEASYRKRLYNDFSLSRKFLEDELGVEARVMVWPYGEYNHICLEEAEKAGFSVMFALGKKLACEESLLSLHRVMIEKNPSIEQFIRTLENVYNPPVSQQRIIHADLDLLYDACPVQLQKNLDEFVERVYTMRVSTVYLQAFSDEEADGNIAFVYFPGRILPLKEDLFSYVTNQLAIRGIEVYAWMPMLSVVLPDEEKNESLRVREYRDGRIVPSTSWYKRLSPFSEEARMKLAMLYEDMAVNARIAGVVFNDDGYLNDREDFHPAALRKYRELIGEEPLDFHKLSPDMQNKWTDIKTGALIRLTEELKDAVLRHRPEAIISGTFSFVRTLYSPVLMNPDSEKWFAQNYALSLDNYDYVAVMSYPLMEGAGNPETWLKKKVEEAGKYPSGLDKTVFKIQAYDWRAEAWIDARVLDGWLRTLVAGGALHLAYYPDNAVNNKPDEWVIRRMMSLEDFPLERE